MKVGLRSLNRIMNHSKISDYYHILQQMEIDGEREEIQDQWYIEKLNRSWIGVTTSISKRIGFINRKDRNLHGYED